MAAGDTTLMYYDSTRKCKIEYWTVTTDGGATAVVYFKMHKVIAISYAWLEDVGAASITPEFVIDNSAQTVTITTNADVDKDLSVTLVGF